MVIYGKRSRVVCFEICTALCRWRRNDFQNFYFCLNKFSDILFLFLRAPSTVTIGLRFVTFLQKCEHLHFPVSVALYILLIRVYVSCLHFWLQINPSSDTVAIGLEANEIKTLNLCQKPERLPTSSIVLSFARVRCLLTVLCAFSLGWADNLAQSQTREVWAVLLPRSTIWRDSWLRHGCGQNAIHEKSYIK